MIRSQPGATDLPWLMMRSCLRQFIASWKYPQLKNNWLSTSNSPLSNPVDKVTSEEQARLHAVERMQNPTSCLVESLTSFSRFKHGHGCTESFELVWGPKSTFSPGCWLFSFWIFLFKFKFIYFNWRLITTLYWFGHLFILKIFVLKDFKCSCFTLWC